jgi:hypothetical protein
MIDLCVERFSAWTTKIATRRGVSGSGELCVVANREPVNSLVFLNNAKYSTIDVRLVAVQEMAELRFFRRHGAAVWQFFQAENRLLEPSVPLQGCIRRLGISR